MSSTKSGPSGAAAYDEWHQNLHASTGLRDPLSFAWHRSAISKVRQFPQGKLLEIGCGRGEFAVHLANAFPEMTITAIDFSETAIQLACDLPGTFLNPPRFLVADAQNLPFLDKSFDWVVSCECLEHVPSPQKMCDDIFRVLKPGGRFCVTTENYLNGMLIGWLRCWIKGIAFDSGSGVQPRENFFVFPMVNNYLQRAGLQVQGTESCHYQWLLLPGVAPARLCTEQFESQWLRFLAKPFGRHYTFFGNRPT